MIADFSNWTGPLSDTQTASLLTAGIDRVIVGAQTGEDGMNYTGQQMSACRARGIVPIAIYEEMYWDYVDRDRVRHAAGFTTRDNEVYLAVEAIAGSPFPPDAGDLLYAAGEIVKAAGKIPGVYTSAEMWRQSGIGNDPRFAGWPLWDAGYNGPDAPWVPFALWTQYKYRQYSNQGLPGITCDLSEDWVAPAPPPIPPSPPVPEPPAPGPTPTGAEMYTPLFAEDPFYQVPAQQLVGAVEQPNVGFAKLPDGVRDVEIHVALTSGTVMVKNGDSPASLTDKTGYAFSVPGTALYAHGRVRLGADGRYLLIPSGQAKIAWVRVAGYYS